MNPQNKSFDLSVSDFPPPILLHPKEGKNGEAKEEGLEELRRNHFKSYVLTQLVSHVLCLSAMVIAKSNCLATSHPRKKCVVLPGTFAIKQHFAFPTII